VTTGNVGSVLAALNPAFIGDVSGRTWNGGDGKTEYYAGIARPKWNFYTATASFRYRPINSGLLSYAGDPNSPYTQSISVALDPFGRQLEWESGDELRIQSKLLRKIKAHSFNLAVNLAQMGQVSRMVAFNLGQLGRSMLALKRGDFATAARAFGTTVNKKSSRLKPNDIAGRWLELQYGWQPLLSDTFEAVRAFHEISQGPRKSLFKARVAKVGWFEGSQSPSTYSHLYKESLQRQIIFEQYEEMTAERQLGLTDPLSVAWEIIPYSFVVDWFVPIGTYLDNLNGIPKLKGRFLTTTTRRRWGYYEFEYLGINRFPGDATGFTGYSGQDSMRSTSVERTASTALEVPTPGFDLRGAVHGRRVWNAISLAQIRFGSGGRTRKAQPFKRSISQKIKLFRGSSLK
jgi:hypothetical protein